MHTLPEPSAAGLGWDEIVAQAEALVAGESDLVANAANLSALLYLIVPRVNWVGVYLLKGGELVVGPFQGKPACVRIPLGRGVCGTAAAERRTVVVPDVHAFAGHIACDADSRSEIVVPLLDGQDALLGVLDVDSPDAGRFTDADRVGFERVAALLVRTA